MLLWLDFQYYLDMGFGIIKIMNLYRLSQNKNNGYDTFDSSIVAAESEEDAILIHPYDELKFAGSWATGSWAKSPKDVKAELIGKAVEGTQRGNILTSFNAG